MKKVLVIVFSMFIALAVVSCGSTSVKDMDAKSTVKDTALREGSAKAQKEAAIASCKKDADKAFDACVAKAGKSAKAKKACETDKTKAYAECDKK